MNYYLGTPTKRIINIPDDIPFAPVITTNTEKEQTHRGYQWLNDKPQEHAIFPVKQESGRLKK